MNDIIKFDIRSALLPEITQFIENLGEKPYRAKQIYEWLHKKGAEEFNEMTNLPLTLRKKLEEVTKIPRIEVSHIQTSVDGTRKYLMELFEGNKSVYIESVLMEYQHGLSICLSSQVGCSMGCDFCASGITGLERNLTTGEILGQLYKISKLENKRITNIVIMGSGEPLDNYDNVINFIKIINDENGYNIGQRHITLSTCGITPKIYKLLEENLQITLAISLHAPNDNIRKKIMKIAKVYTLDGLLKACRLYAKKRRVTFEYIMLDGINDSVENAKELASKIKEINCHINLIPVNKVKGKPYSRSCDKTINNFAKILENSGIEVTIRRELGADIDAACGQLRNKKLSEGI